MPEPAGLNWQWSDDEGGYWFVSWEDGLRHQREWDAYYRATDPEYGMTWTQKLERRRILKAGGDPNALTGAARIAAVERARKMERQEKALRAAPVKRLHSERLRQAMPWWADVEAVRAIYAEAQRVTDETKEPHEVDHIVPLLGKNVSGLHVEYNLRVVTRTANRRKSNRHG